MGGVFDSKKSSSNIQGRDCVFKTSVIYTIDIIYLFLYLFIRLFIWVVRCLIDTLVSLHVLGEMNLSSIIKDLVLPVSTQSRESKSRVSSLKIYL